MLAEWLWRNLSFRQREESLIVRAYCGRFGAEAAEVGWTMDKREKQE